jgi:hypothetical protein
LLRCDGREPARIEDWSAALDFADRAQLTPLLARLELPPEARARVEGARNAVRAERLAAAYAEIAPLFDHVLLKGATHVPDFVPESRYRVQYDLDVYVPRGEAQRATDALRGLGYEPIATWKDVDHLPTMVRKTGWEWRGDYFDPEMPVSVEVHFRFWDPDSLQLRADGVEQFWDRRRGSRLDPVDILGYAALHLTRHVLRGNARPAHIWEIANFLHTHHDGAFWSRWHELHSASVRRLEAVAFRLAEVWFGCALPSAVRAEIDALPARARRWFEDYAWSPLETGNKRDVWLHLALCESTGARARVLRRKLAPLAPPGAVDAIFIPEDRMTLSRRAKKYARYTAFTARRAWYHARLLVPTLWEGFTWWRRAQ